MRRITFAVASTIAVLVLLFSYRTSTGHSGSATAQQVSAARVISGGSTPAPAAGSGSGQGPDPQSSRADPITTVTVTRSDTATSSSSAASQPAAAPPPTSAAAGQNSRSAATSSTTSTSSAPATSAAAAASQTVDGAAEMTRYGVVQVRVVVTGSTITDVNAVQYPQSEQRDQEINSAAIPELRNEVLAAQSANVQGVSGATFTTDGYLGSLQSALDAIGFRS